MIELKINYSGNLSVSNDAPDYAYISQDKYSIMIERYGMYGFGWYFVNTNTIKAYDGSDWDYISK
jgi:hypothetical protein